MSEKRLRIIMMLHAVWVMLVIGLGLWWARLLIDQAHVIETLAEQLGPQGLGYLGRTTHVKRMLLWESGTFLLLVLVASLILMWLYWRERTRAKSLQAFFASVTHELKTPLTSIRLQAESLQDEVPQSKLLKRLLADTLRLESQVERTLELARVEGGAQYYAQPTNLKQFLNRLVQPWRESHPQILIEVKVPDGFEVLMDRAGLSVIVRNLLENSLRHSGSDKPHIVFEASYSKNHVQLLIKDSGQGFDGEVRRLGKLYGKGPQSSGAGVGLYLVRSLMQKMGGTARWFNQNGFVVELTIPADPNSLGDVK